LYETSGRFKEGEIPASEILWQDILDTLLFPADRFDKIAFPKQRRAIDPISTKTVSASSE
jgi:hypothetical protein